MTAGQYSAKTVGRAAIILLALSVVLSACARPLPPLPVENDSAIIGLTLKDISSVGPDDITQIVLARLHQQEEISKQDSLLFSNNHGALYYLFGNDHYYSFNAPPGTYAVVGFARRNSTFWFLPKDDILSTRTKVLPGRINFMGNFEVSALPFFGIWIDPDTAQENYWSLLREITMPNALLATVGFMTLVNLIPIPSKAWLKSSESHSAAEIEFLNASKEILAGGGWDAHIERRLAELQ